MGSQKQTARDPISNLLVDSISVEFLQDCKKKEMEQLKNKTKQLSLWLSQKKIEDILDGSYKKWFCVCVVILSAC